MALQDLLPAPPDRRETFGSRISPAFFLAAASEDTTLAIASPLSSPTGDRVIHVDLDTLTADVDVSVTWTGATPSAVEARYVTPTSATAWAPLIASPSGSGGSGTMLALPKGQGAIEVRVRGAEGIVTSRCITIGIVIAPWGQSNSYGGFLNPQLYTGAGYWRALKFAGSGEGIWADLEDPTGSNAAGGKGSLWPLVATKLSDELECPVVVMNCAVGGTGFVADAYPPEANGNKWRPEGSNTTAMISTIQVSGVNGAIGPFAQGERESGPNTPLGVLPGEYVETVEETRAKISTDCFGDPDAFKMLVIQTGSQPTAGRTNLNLTRLAHRQMWDSNPNVIPGFATNDIALEGGDLHHWTTDGQADVISDRVVHSLLVWMGRKVGGRGPQYQSAVVVDTTHVDVTFLLENLGAITLGSTNTGVWRPIDGSTRRTVSSVTVDVVDDEAMFHLTLSAPINQMPIELSYGDDDDASGCTILDAAGLPPEPFWGVLVYDSDGPDEEDDPATIAWEAEPADVTFSRAGPPAVYVAVEDELEPEDDIATIAWESDPEDEVFVRNFAATYTGSV